MTRVAALTVLSALVALGVACRHDEASPPARSLPPVDGRVVEARRAPVAEPIEAGGLVQARTTALVASRLVADVRAVLVATGDHVRAGQPLVTLDDRDLVAGRTRATASAAAATQGRAAAEAERTAAQAALALATVSHDRVAGLHAKDAATTQELDQARAALDGARARVAAADARITEAGAGAEAAQAAVVGAEIGLSWATVRAPFDGIVTEKMIEPGNQVGPGTPLLRVEASTGARVEVSLDWSRTPALAVGQAVEVVLDGLATPLQGRIEEVGRAVHPGSQAALVKVGLPPDTAARSGQFARVRFAGASRDAVVIPPAAVVRRGQLTAVYAVEDGLARLRLVSLGVTTPTEVEVLSGLAEGDRLLEAPPLSIADGAPVSGQATASTKGGAR